MRELNVAVVQMEPQLGKMESNVAKMLDFITKIATAQPVDVIVFPELAATGYEGGVRFAQMAQTIPGPLVNMLGQRAAEFGVHVVVGMAARADVETVLYNSAVLIGPDGNVVGDYRKVHLQAEERMIFRPGFKIAPIATEVGVLGVMLGWDLAFPEVARSLVLDGAEVLLVPAAWERQHVAMWRNLLVSRAYENGVFIAAANRIGAEPSYTFAGQSAILGPTGNVLAALEDPAPATAVSEEGEVTLEPPAPQEGYIVVRLDLDEVRRVREATQIIQARQPSAYRALVRKY